MFIYWFLIIPISISSIATVAGNICDYTANADPICCPGWIKNVYGDCVKSECSHDCGNGRCVGLDVCECYNGKVTRNTCPYIDINDVCPDDCNNRGTCHNGRCRCHLGFSGNKCEVMLLSKCYMSIDRGLCKEFPSSMQLTIEQCCSIFRVAWGVPCQFCNNIAFMCDLGFERINNQCEDIDECLLGSICLNGRCINEFGSYRCICPSGYHLNETTKECVPDSKNACERMNADCGSYGTCISLNPNSYRCQCRRPYKASYDGQRCLRNVEFNICSLYRDLCVPYGVCVPIGRSYYCDCRQGFQQSNDMKSCLVQKNTDINPLPQQNPCDNEEIRRRCYGGGYGKCRQLSLNNYECICGSGYRASNSRSECIRADSGDSGNGRPSMNNGYYCSLSQYYSMCRGGQCIPDSRIGYRCVCLPGFVLSQNQQECKEGNSNYYCSKSEYYEKCRGGQCVADSNYGYRCICLSGYTSTFDRRECKTATQKPSTETKSYYCLQAEYSSRCNGGQCVEDSNYGFRCICRPGYAVSEDGRSCRFITPSYITPRPTPAQNNGQNEGYCKIKSYRDRCAGGECYPDARFGFRCTCLPGFKSEEDPRTCYKVESKNERDDTTRSQTNYYCSQSQYYTLCRGGKCIDDIKNRYRCQCLPGFTLSYDKRECKQQINQLEKCEINRQRCKGGPCFDISTGYICICPSQYQASASGKDCVPKDYREINQIKPMGGCTKALDNEKSSCYPGYCSQANRRSTCQCPFSFTSSDDGSSCKRDYSTCSKCFYGCLQSYTSSEKCRCPYNHKELLFTGLCIRQDPRMSYFLLSATNQEVNIQFQGVSIINLENSNSVKDNIGSLLIPSYSNPRYRLAKCTLIKSQYSRMLSARRSMITRNYRSYQRSTVINQHPLKCQFVAQ